MRTSACQNETVRCRRILDCSLITTGVAVASRLDRAPKTHHAHKRSFVSCNHCNILHTIVTQRQNMQKKNTEKGKGKELHHIHRFYSEIKRHGGA